MHFKQLKLKWISESFQMNEALAKENICLEKELFTKFYPRILVNQTWLVLLDQQAVEISG